MITTTKPYNETDMMRICMDVFELNGIEFDIDQIRSKKRYPVYVMNRKLCVMALKNAHYGFESISRFLHRSNHSCALYHFNKCVWIAEYRNVMIEPVIEKEIKEKIRFHQMEINKLMGGVAV